MTEAVLCYVWRAVLLKRQHEESQSNTRLDGARQSRVCLAWGSGVAGYKPAHRISQQAGPVSMSMGLSRHRSMALHWNSFLSGQPETQAKQVSM